MTMIERAHRVLNKEEEGWFLRDPIPSNPDGTWDMLYVYSVLRRGFELAGPTVCELRYRLEGAPDTCILVAERNGDGISPGIVVMLEKDAHEGNL